MSEKVHSIRRSQLIFNSGPGAIVDLSDFSGIVTGLEHWNLDKAERIETRTRRGFPYLFRPPVIMGSLYGGADSYPRGVVPIRRFPTWVQCSNPGCNTFGQFWNIRSPRNEFKCQRCQNKLVPARLIRICKNGHISDFPWDVFYHDNGEVCSLAEPKYRLIASDQQSGSLSDLKLYCDCNLHPVGKNLGEVYNFPLGKTCRSRNRPWLGDEESCDKPAIVVLRGASNVYFPVIQSELTIPSAQSKFDLFFSQDFSRHLSTLRQMKVDANIRRTVIEGLITEEMTEKLGLEKTALANRIESHLDDTLSADVILADEDTIRREEFEVLHDPSIVSEDIIPKVFSAGIVELDPVMSRLGLERLVSISRLQEIRVLQGFKRVDPTPMPGQGKMVDIGSSVNGRYPAVEVNGEGLFLSFKEDILSRWETLPSVVDRCKKVVQFAKERSTGRNLPFEITPRSIFLHSVAHALIKQMSLFAGYSSVAIREKIYCGETYNGILLYTGESDSEGTMGGITSLATLDKFSVILFEAIEDSRWCSSDPLCRENAHDKDVSENLASCHACLFLSETSCELSNRFLDRTLIISDSDDIGFFNERI